MLKSGTFSKDIREINFEWIFANFTVVMTLKQLYVLLINNFKQTNFKEA